MIVVQPGARVRVRVASVVKTVTVVKVDESTFPGKVIVKDDDGKEHEIHIEIGWPDCARAWFRPLQTTRQFLR